MLPPTTLPNNSAAASGSRPAQAPLPAAGGELQAVVKSVARGDSSGQVFRIQVEANNRLMELITRAPLATGDRINLSRTASGELQIRLPVPTAQPQTGAQGTPANSGNQILLSVAGQQAQTAALQSLPLNMPRQALVMQSTPLTAQSGQQPSTQGSSNAANRAGDPAARPAPGTNNASTTTAATGSQGSSASAANTSAPTARSAAPAPAQAQAQTPTPATADKAPTTGGSTAQPSAPPAAAASQSAAAQARPAGGPTTPPQTAQPPASGQASPPPAPPSTPTTGQQAGQAQVYRAHITQMSNLPSPTTGTGGTASSSGAAPATQGTATTGTAPGASAQPANTQPGATTNAPPQPRSQPATGSTGQSTQAPASTSPQAPPANPANSANSQSAQAMSQKGQQLTRTVGQQQPPPAPTQHQVQLNLAGERINLVSPRPLTVGQQVMLTRTDAQHVSLSPLPATSTPVQNAVQQPAVQQALRDALPQQIPFGDALNQMVQLSQSPAARNQSAVNQLVQSMLSLFGVTPGSEDAGEAVKRNLQQGGLLTEARLNQGLTDKAAPQTDLKQQLGQLLKASEQLPENARQQMTRLVDALQARATSQQVSSLQSWKEQPDGSMERAYRLDLPIRQGEKLDNAELTITERRERQPDGDMLSLWSAALHFDLDDYGSVDARLSLEEGWRLQLQFWAEFPHTRELINTRLEPFTGTLHRQGFVVDNVQVFAGRPQQEALNEVRQRLVDVHT